jgi:hypothetical protein
MINLYYTDCGGEREEGVGGCGLPSSFLHMIMRRWGWELRMRRLRPLLIAGLVLVVMRGSWGVRAFMRPVANGGRLHQQQRGIRQRLLGTTLKDLPQQIFDEYDFCLTSSDTALSGPSMSKALNSATNQVIKNILVLTSKEDEGPAEASLAALLSNFEKGYKSYPGFADAVQYLDATVSLGSSVGCKGAQAVPSSYAVAYRRVALVLEDFGCSIEDCAQGRVSPKDANVCLSVLDWPNSPESATRALNALANRVVRVMCVGNDGDLTKLMVEMESKRPQFMQKWVGKDWEGSDESKFYSSLEALLSEGMTATPKEMSSSWANSFQRLQGLLVKSLGAANAPASSRVLTSFTRWEASLRSDLTQSGWDETPSDLVGVWKLLGDEMDLTPSSSTAISSLANSDMATAITLQRDGEVIVDQRTGLGRNWRLSPGPTHLDTCSFEVYTITGEVLGFIGYIDRGARIESRFSKRPLKMTGRLERIIRGQKRPSTRFSMLLVERQQDHQQQDR